MFWRKTSCKICLTCNRVVGEKVSVCECGGTVFAELVMPDYTVPERTAA